MQVVIGGPKYDKKSLASRGDGRVSQLPRRLGVDAQDIIGKRLLEFGCGRGEVTLAARRILKADAIGVDIVPRWKGSVPKDDEAFFFDLDILENKGEIEPVDFIHSYTVFEHVAKPVESIQSLFQLLKPGGRAYLSFNLYRGASASHLRVHLDFPWVHLIHTDDDIRQMMIAKHGKDRGPSWVNKLTYAHYLLHFQKTGFDIEKHWYDRFPMTDEFYAKYEDKLSCYPRYELDLNFMHVRLVKPVVSRN